MTYSPSKNRYSSMAYNYCGASGLKLPSISLGLWHNFGEADSFGNAQRIIRTAFDEGITHFDLANNYGPPPGSAEINFGQIFKKNFSNHRDELIISTKAGYYMWDGPYGEWGSRKYLIASLNQSLKRLGIDYVDIFYSHRYDPNTPLEETMGALDFMVKQGKALYAGISNYPVEATKEASEILRKLGTPCLIHQPRYSMLDRWVEKELLDTLERNGIGCIAYSPLSQGLLSNRYLHGIPKGSRASKPNGFLKKEHITSHTLKLIEGLNGIAMERGQSLAQMAIAWLLKDWRVTSVLVGASSSEQLLDCIQSVRNTNFSSAEIESIDRVLEFSKLKKNNIPNPS